MKKSRILACPVLNSKTAMILCRRFSYRWKLSRYLKRFMMETSWIRGGCTKKCVMWKVWRSRHCAVIGKQLWNSNDRNWVRWAVLGLSQDRVCTNTFENFSVKCLKRDQSNDTKLNPPLFSLVNTLHFSLRVEEIGGGGWGLHLFYCLILSDTSVPKRHCQLRKL